MTREIEEEILQDSAKRFEELLKEEPANGLSRLCANGMTQIIAPEGCTFEIKETTYTIEQRARRAIVLSGDSDLPKGMLFYIGKGILRVKSSKIEFNPCRYRIICEPIRRTCIKPGKLQR